MFSLANVPAAITEPISQDDMAYSIELLDTPDMLLISVYEKNLSKRQMIYDHREGKTAQRAFPSWVQEIFRKTNGSIYAIVVFPTEIYLVKKSSAQWEVLVPTAIDSIRTMYAPYGKGIPVPVSRKDFLFGVPTPDPHPSEN